MKPTRHNSVPPGSQGTRHAVRSALWVLAPLGIAVPVSGALPLAGAGGDWMGALWLAAVLWAIAASFVQAMWQGLRHGDWSGFRSCDLPGHDDDFDFETRSGAFAFMRVRARHESLMREGDRLLHDHDHRDSRS